MPRRSTAVLAGLLAAVLSVVALASAPGATARTEKEVTSVLISADTGSPRQIHLDISIGASGTPTGTVTLYDGKADDGAFPLFAGGQSITITGVKPGPHTYRVVYSGDATYQGSESASAVVITTTSTIAETLPAKVAPGKRAKGVVKVTGDGWRATGMIQVVAGSKVLAQAYLKKGKAAVKLPKLSRGVHRLKILYGGSTVVLGSRHSMRITQL